MRLSRRILYRTLLQRQHLLERVDLEPARLCGHVIGLQAQERLAPYLSLSARLETFDPYAVTRGLEDRTLIRLLTLRGTVHLLSAQDAGLRMFTSSVHEREVRTSQSIGNARQVDRAAFDEAVETLLAAGPLPQKQLGEALAERFPAYLPTQLGQLARSRQPLVQVPPRGSWKGAGSVVYQRADTWLGATLQGPDVEELVRRYLRAFGPGAAADMTAWSGVTRLGPVFETMAARDDLVRHEDHEGRAVYDLPGEVVADEDAPAPVRLLGCYDNVWLSHARRDRVTDPDKRTAWMGVNGGSANTVFVDGMLEGLWRVDDGRVRVIETLRPLTRVERAGLDDEIVRVEAMLAM